MRWGLLVCVAACSFDASAPLVPRDAPLVAGDAGLDAAHADAPPTGSDAASTADAPPLSACDLGPGAIAGGGSGTDRGKVGNSGGGGHNSWLACPGGQSIVGVGLEMSNRGVNGTSKISAHSIELGCSTLSISGSGVGHTGSTVTLVRLDVGSDNTDGFTPATWTDLAQCPAGAFVSGMHVYSSQFMSFFLDATIDCTLLTADLHVAQTTPMPIVNSGSDNMFPSGADCSAGEQAVGFLTDTGGGFDSFQLYCAPATCD